MNRTIAEGALILAPHGRDAAIAEAILREAGLEGRCVPDLPALVHSPRSGAGFGIVVEDELRGADLRELASFIADQAEWSDFPFIVLTARGAGLERNPAAVRLLETLGNVTFLERPFHPTTLVSLAHAARRARLRQYDARIRLEAIRAGQERLRVALATGGLGAWTLDPGTRELIASPESKAHFGRGPDETFTYEDLLLSVHPDDRDRRLAAIDASLASGANYNLAYRVLWPDGSLHWVQIDGRREPDARGRSERVVGVSQDITARRRADDYQAALIALGDGLREMTEAADMSFLAGTLHFRDYGSYIDNLKRGELVAIADARLDPRTALNAAAPEAIHARAVFNMPLVDHNDLVALLYLNDKGAREWLPEGIVFVREVADRTHAAIERRNAEAALAALDESLERQVEERTRERDRTWLNSQDLPVVVSAEGTFLAVNPAWTTGLGWRPDQVIGRNHAGFSHPEDSGAAVDAHERAKVTVLRQFENRVRHKDGSYRWVSWVASGDGDRIYASGRHVTAEKEAQLELEATQDQLRQAQKLAAVGQLTGGLAHDFNNLLAAISDALELMQIRMRQGRSGELDRYVELAQTATRRAAALTHRMLAFSRRQTLDPKPTDINRLVSGMGDLLRRSVGPQNEIEVVGAAGLWTTLIDPNQLENALLNLCINARDAMNDGGRITVETANKWLAAAAARERDLPAGQYVSLCVTDTGTGMADDTIARAFDPFFTTKPQGEGAGLGLSMIYGFVRQSGGQVRVYSELGQGTTMCLYVRRVYAPDDAAPQLGPGAPAASSGDGQLDPGMHVLTKPFAMDALASRVREIIGER